MIPFKANDILRIRNNNPKVKFLSISKAYYKELSKYPVLFHYDETPRNPTEVVFKPICTKS